MIKGSDFPDIDIWYETHPITLFRLIVPSKSVRVTDKSSKFAIGVCGVIVLSAPLAIRGHDNDYDNDNAPTRYQRN